MSMSTLPKKRLKIVHVNICGLRNKVRDIDNSLTSDKIHILAISETNVDITSVDATVGIQGYSFYRKDRDIYGEGVAMYIQSHIPVKFRGDRMLCDVEMLWLQVQLLHLKSMGCYYRPPSSNS